MNKLCFLGASLDTGNQGCSALTASLIKLALDSIPDADIFLLYGSRTSGTKELKVAGRKIKVHIVNYRLSPKSRINEHLSWIFLMAVLYYIIPVQSLRKIICRYTPWIQTLEQADIVGDIRGGDSFSDIYGVERVIFGAVECGIPLLMGKKLVLLPQTFGPYKSIVSKYLARFIMMRSARIYARDHNSIKLTEKILGRKGSHKSVAVCPDVAFTLEAITPDIPNIQPELYQTVTVPLIGLNISGLLYSGGYTQNNMFGLRFDYKEFAHNVVKVLMEKTDAHILLIPHVYSSGVESDSEACREVQENADKKYRERIHRVSYDYNQNEIKGLIGLCDFFIGSRMHACIAALSQTIPSVGIAYSKKFFGVFETIGLENNVIDAREFNGDEVIEQIIIRYEKKDQAKKLLIETIPRIQSQIRSIFQELFASIE